METGHVNRNFAIDGGLREEARVIYPAQWSLVILKIFSPSPLPLLPPLMTPTMSLRSAAPILPIRS